MMRSRGEAFLWFPLVVLAVVAVDQVTKWLALAHLEPHAPVPLTGFLDLTLVFNRGAAFGFLSTQGGWQLTVFAVIAVAVVGYVVHHIYLEAWRSGLSVVSYALIGGGAVGNLIDRVRFGYVVDFVDFHLGQWHFYVFNAADSALTIGVVGLLVAAWIGHRRHGRAKQEETVQHD